MLPFWLLFSFSLDHLLCEGEQKSKPKPVPTVHTLRSMVSGDLPFDQTFSGLHVLQKKAEIENYRDCEKLLAMNKENFHLCVVVSIMKYINNIVHQLNLVSIMFFN